MRIYKMRATFGKLEDQVLELQPGLNVIEAPNEWGKSTWCAFLVAMLYGIDTRARTTQTTLAEKEKYAPWSGSPMEGRIDLNWNGREITIERRTKGRTPFGVFKAYETATGLEVPELTAANCGQMLLGVERSVFTRAGFLRLSDLPVTQDEALRRRLNALVTTGDESGAGDMLAAKLRDLKNRCRYNRSGLLPQAEAELSALEEKQRELFALGRQAEECAARQKQAEEYLEKLKNHQAALRYQVAQADAERVRAANAAYEEAVRRTEKLEENCARLPAREAAEEKLREGRSLQLQWMSMQMEDQTLPGAPAEPDSVDAFKGMEPEALMEKARTDAAQYAALRQAAEKKPAIAWLLLALGLLGCAVSAVLQLWSTAAVAAIVVIAGAVMLILAQKRRKDLLSKAGQLAQRYPWREPERWITEVENYVNQVRNYQKQLAQYRAARGDLDQRGAAIRQQMQDLTRGQDLRTVLERGQQVIAAWDALENARRDQRQAESHLRSIQAMAKGAEPPAFADTLTYTEAETARLVSDYTARQRQLQLQMGKIQGAMTAIGDGQVLQERIDTLHRRIEALEETCAALETAQQTLSMATEQLQRRFAPRITERARELFAALTDGRYDRLNLTRELAVNAGAEGEATLHSAQWRSEGTVDQLYFALRLAVAEELTPDAPLILDDALVRFDDRRLKNAMVVLGDAAQSKQVILFTCQSRETEFRPF